MFVTSCSPGPNNILASYSGFNFGILKTIPHMFGVALGYTSMITILDVGLIFPFKYELKKQFDDLIYEIVKTRTLNYSDDINQLIKQMTPTIEKINNLLEEKTK